MPALHPVSCKICGGASDFVYSQDCSHRKDAPPMLHVYRCRACGLLFIGNSLTDEQLTLVYQSESDPDSYYQEVNKTTSCKVARTILDLGPLIGRREKGKSLLDFGCGGGHLLEAMGDSYPKARVAGLELPSKAATNCLDRGLSVYTCGLTSIPERFHVVTLLDVAEHVLRPREIFSQCFDILDDGGYLYIHTPRTCFWDRVALMGVNIPLIKRWSRLWLGTRVSIFHLQLWTDKALTLALEQAGYRVIYCKAELGLSWPLDRYVKIYLTDRLHLPQICAKIFTVFAKLLFVWFGTLRNKAILLAQKRLPADGIGVGN